MHAAAPSPAATQQHRRQQQCQQKQDVVKPDPDVPHALPQVLHKLSPGSGRLGELHDPALRPQHGTVRDAVQIELEQSSVLGVEVKQQAVLDRQRAMLLRAAATPCQHRIATVGMLVHLQGLGLEGTGTAPPLQAEAAACPSLQLALLLLQLPPGDLVVAVGVKANGKLNVAQGNVPLHADLIALGLDRQVTVARFVRQRSASHQHQPGHGHGTRHPLA